ncbi:DUF4190 domain-containing protein [Microbacterium indicum]|uniref:DUF4190 domain-containing protein n=1 Tax=Microbacterium indicum TaxID=358100 RepID=UPI0004092F91|nr:DUF4190 domain-containing protein [Microbacterium indicum]
MSDQQYQSQYYPPAPQYQPPTGYTPLPPTGPANPMALTALILGIVPFAALVLFWIPIVGTILVTAGGISAILAVVFGHIALSQIKRSGQSGKGMAVTGLVLGYISIGFTLLLILIAVALFGGLAAVLSTTSGGMA